MARKHDTRGGRRNEAAAANGKAVGRPITIGAGSRHTVTLDEATLAVLRSINDNLSAAIRELVRRQS